MACDSRAAKPGTARATAAACAPPNGRPPPRNAASEHQQRPFPSATAARSSWRQRPGASSAAQPGPGAAAGSAVRSATFAPEVLSRANCAASASAKAIQQAAASSSQRRSSPDGDSGPAAPIRRSLAGHAPPGHRASRSAGAPASAGGPSGSSTRVRNAGTTVSPSAAVPARERPARCLTLRAWCRDQQAQLVVRQQAWLVGRPAGRYGRQVVPELRQLRYFVAVAERGSFTRAADDLFVAQQAVSQQIRALENGLGVRLLWRTSRRVELTPAGRVFLPDCRRILAAADRAVRRVQEAARGEAGTVRICYTLTAAYQALPALLDRLRKRYPQLTAETREVFAADVPRLLRAGQVDLAIAPATDYPGDLAQQLIRSEGWQIAVSDQHRLAARQQVPLRELRYEQVELWPRDMAPGYYDAVMTACRAAGFEPRLDADGAGSTVWSHLTEGRGVGLVVSSMAAHLPAGITVARIEPPAPPPLSVTVVWQPADMPPAVPRVLDAASELVAEQARGGRRVISKLAR